MAVNAGSSLCIVHFEGKLGPEKQLTNETLQTIVNRRREWLELPEHEKYNTSRNIAEKSFEYISDGIEKKPGATWCYVVSLDMLSKFHGHH